MENQLTILQDLKNKMDKNKNYLDKWSLWINSMHEDVEKILTNRMFYKKYLDLVKNNKDIQSPPDFHIWIRENYVTSIVTAIRRQIDTRTDVVSTARLLIEIKDHSKILTRDWYKSLHDYDWADDDFTNVAGEGSFFDKNIAENDLKDLAELGKDIKKYANTYVAHKSKDGMTKLPTFNDVNKFIDKLEEIMKKYILLFTASGYSELLPTWQYDWEEIFTKKWIKDNK